MNLMKVFINDHFKEWHYPTMEAGKPTEYA